MITDRLECELCEGEEMYIEIDPVVDEEAELKTEQGQSTWSQEYPSLKNGGWFWLRDSPTAAPRLTELNGGYNFYEPLGVVCETTEYLGPVTPVDAEQLVALRAAARAAIKVLSMGFPGSLKRKEAIAQLEAALNPKN